MSTVTLQPVDQNLLPRLLEIAVTDTEPHEVMPDLPGPSQWTDARRTAFMDYHRPADGAAYAVLVDGQLIGAVRIIPAEAPGAVQAHIWLRHSARGKAHSTEALCVLIDEARARGASALVAETHVSNQAAVSMLRTLGAMVWEDPESGSVHATLRVGEGD
jgi:RimJ/RimL family protein N-acetyltransferase